ncbi:DNA gyrase inhibitor YacG [Roseomonas rosulenta]|uniref:DNA gyrase inhibitor YacG n=1 Tax=Roseomonas rosulenta TaxID=2748667 RepID=UPI0018DFAB1B|nr:DNA gyrase inhibitor YacG [Roseomonas rosulenta]
MSDAPRPRPALRCPICRRPAAEATRPFCSERCAQADLGRWLSESYAIPASAPEETED